MSHSQPKTRRLRALLGGTFDPIHWGHLRPALHALEWLEADELRLIPSAQPPHRDYPGASAEQRLAMVKLATDNDPNVYADDWELNQSRPSYTTQTLSELKRRWPNDTLVFLLGEDAIAKLNTWYLWRELLDHAHFAILSRPDNAPQWHPEVTDFCANRWLTNPVELRQSDHGSIIRVPNATQSIAATDIRTMIQRQQSWEPLVPPAVAAFIRSQGLYR